MKVYDFALTVLRNVGVESADCSIDLGLGFVFGSSVGNLKVKAMENVE